MKQFRNSCYWANKDGEVYKFYPAKKYKLKRTVKGKTYYTTVSKINGIEYGVDRWKKMTPTLRRKTGYWVFNLQDKSVTDKGYFNISLHQIVAECFHGPCPDGYEVDHIDGNKSNNKASNLQYLTPYENRKKGCESKIGMKYNI